MVGCLRLLKVLSTLSVTGLPYREKLHHIERHFVWQFKQRSSSRVSSYTSWQPLLVLSNTTIHLTLPSQNHHFIVSTVETFLTSLKRKKKNCTFTLDKLQRPMTSILCGWVGVNQSHLWPSHSFPLWFAPVFPTSTPHPRASPPPPCERPMSKANLGFHSWSW